MQTTRSFGPSLFALLCAGACSNGGGSAPPPSLGIVTTIPPANAVIATRTPEITIEFDADLAAASVAAEQIEVRTVAGPVVGTTALVGVRQLRFAAASPLPWGTIVSATLRAGVRTQAGAALASDVAWTFAVSDLDFSTRSLAIADASTTRRAVVTTPPASQQFVVAVGTDVWVVPEPVPPPFLGQLPSHETIPFAPDLLTATLDGALAGVHLVDRGAGGIPDLFLQMAVRHADGTWQNEDTRVLASASASLFTFEGGREGAFVATLFRGASASLRFAVGPRPTPPVLGLFDNPTTLLPTTVAATGLDSAVVCQGDVFTTLPATYTRYNLATDPPTPTATWQRPFGVLASDPDGLVLALSEGATDLTLARMAANGTVAGEVTVDRPASMPLAIWRILPAHGAAAAIGARFGECRSFRLDASEAVPTTRAFALDQDAIDTGAWDACYAANGDLLVVARRRATAASDGSLWLWRQRPGRDWEGREVAAEIPGRQLGRPALAVDADGFALFAAPRTAPAEVLVVQSLPPAVVPAPR